MDSSASSLLQGMPALPPLPSKPAEAEAQPPQKKLPKRRKVTKKPASSTGDENVDGINDSNVDGAIVSVEGSPINP